ncbi:MAG: hypothetical protein US68_C0007G0027 [Candidatus Shapirobacteria bacterium GW2011_GWE1_38_10]|uniref:Uncharacterized protein n=1 Tax=Candidatus Shapirobacteria bacterium GW2011_GWE1_38_10 TaxID=1618488 RepID=A0A0G0KM51_9BACT|nr:MAG: hypothetical protein US46_C0007G0019 [Candidatus Shapirobacteria bacterium GW2011_GWF2_37_20]KKQ50264.1 MAG: hypothetical protein US68_C0007G0027 [Candidatus Shapirobacteria bacterium GW2011_GWE1_38_10]KKQ64798.1 MAG: hypothetical protein US85_C0003G0020 [Candidatus Shapirobacteria bacterium GW2011_GWF1_38_23]HBP51325.1 hypothetical protein [Candidatus Shapirobacteria bacterium]
MINMSPELLKKINELLSTNGYNLVHSALNNLDKDNENHRNIYSNGEVKILMETTKFIKK